MSLSADFHEAPKAREYQELMDIIHRRGRHGEERYGALMQKEQRVLDTVDRVVNDARVQEVRADDFFRLSLTQIGLNLAKAVHQTYLELMQVRRPSQVLPVLARPERRIYMGLLLMGVAFFLFLFQIGGGSC